MGIRVFLGSKNKKVIHQLGQFLTENGIHVVGGAENGYDLLRRVYTLQPDIALIDETLYGMSGYEISETLLMAKVCSVIILIRATDETIYTLLKGNSLFTEIVKPMRRDMLMSVIESHIECNRRLGIGNEQKNIAEDAQEQITIQEAKHYLIQYFGLTEDEAHRRIQKKSMDQGVTKVKIAQSIIKIYQKYTSGF